jgi:hypothetical protein
MLLFENLTAYLTRSNRAEHLHLSLKYVEKKEQTHEFQVKNGEFIKIGGNKAN